LLSAENRILVDYRLDEHAQKNLIELPRLGRCDAQTTWGSVLARKEYPRAASSSSEEASSTFSQPS
jgi:hypothetical protein